MVNNGKLIRVSNSFLKILDKIIEQEKLRGVENPSYRTASNILVRRIEMAGGIKEFQ